MGLSKLQSIREQASNELLEGETKWSNNEIDFLTMFEGSYCLMRSTLMWSNSRPPTQRRKWNQKKPRTKKMIIGKVKEKAKQKMSYVPDQHFTKFVSPSSMGKRGARLPGFCLNRIRPHARVRSPPAQANKHENTTIATTIDQKTENSCSSCEEKSDEGVKQGSVIGRKIMIVVDSSLEAKGAVQWALTHTVQNQDTIVLLHVMKPSNKQGTDDEESSKEIAPRANELASSFKNMCQVKRPEVQTEITVIEGKEKGKKIVEEAKKQGVALLVLGQKKRSTTWRLLMMWAGQRVTGGVVEYCIQNAHCMAIAVRRKSKKSGGYMITTKRHKDFWLLA
ncbi:universal stress protein PHOS32 isoform X2 [Vigna angularis]|nr:universal stress protein PHOS32 isoform X2 [Vigna angularis]